VQYVVVADRICESSLANLSILTHSYLPHNGVAQNPDINQIAQWSWVNKLAALKKKATPVTAWPLISRRRETLLRAKPNRYLRAAAKSKHLANHLITSGPPPRLLDRDQEPRKTLPSLDAVVGTFRAGPGSM
jgi:hypothetical protein